MTERDPHHDLNNPEGEPDETEWPDPFDKREDPRAGDHPPTGSRSTSEPHPSAWSTSSLGGNCSEASWTQ